MKIINTLIKKLSQITIDGDKDWGGNRISNVGAPTAAGDVLRKGTRQTMAEVPDGTLNQVIKGSGAGANPGYGTVGHGELGGVTSDQHHSRSHDHSLAADGSPIATAGVPDLPASKITSGRFGVARLPEGTSGYVLTAQGAGVDPAYKEPAAGAPANASYVTISAEPGLSNEKVLGNDIILGGAKANQPAAGIVGRLFQATDIGVLYRDNGVTWDALVTQVVKSADETVNNSTTLQNDDELLFAVGANDVWEFTIYLLINSGDTPDFNLHFSVPTNAVCHASCLHHDAFGNVRMTNFYGGGTAIVGGINDIEFAAVIHGFAIIGNFAGNVQLQWAQNTANASNTKVLQNSLLIARRIR